MADDERVLVAFEAQYAVTEYEPVENEDEQDEGEGGDS